MLRFVCFFIIFTSSHWSWADELGLLEVLHSTKIHYPEVIAELAELRSANAETTLAKGAFDLVFSSSFDQYVNGYYDGEVFTSKIEQPLKPLGANVYAQYKRSRGDFPIYEDINFTNQDGQAKLGIVFSLLKNRDIDQRRLQIENATLTQTAAELEFLLTQVGVQQRATAAYWKWVIAGQKLEVLRNLLVIAEDRTDGLKQEVEQGARAEIFLTENEQTITQRRGALINAERDYQYAANTLALYVRNEQGQPMRPGKQQLPKQLPPATPKFSINTVQLDDMMQQHPDVLLLSNAIDRARNQLALSNNDLLPSLNLDLGARHGLGLAGEGGPSRDSTDTYVGLNFTVPLQQRSAKAKRTQAQAKLAALESKRQLTQEKITVALQDLILNLNYAAELTQLAGLEVEQTETLQAAEQSRFASGASDFFLLNIREQSVANARIKALSAQLSMHITESQLAAATLNLPQLGLN